MLRFFAVAAAALFLVAAPCAAQTVSPVDESVQIEPARLAAARRFMTAAHVDTAMNQVVAAMMPQMMRSIAAADHLTQEQSDMISRVVLEQLQADTPDLVEKMARVYATRLSEADLNAAAAFYESEAGRHFVDAQPILAQDGAAVGRAWSQRALPEVLARIRALSAAPNVEHP